MAPSLFRHITFFLWDPDVLCVSVSSHFFLFHSHLSSKNPFFSRSNPVYVSCFQNHSFCISLRGLRFDKGQDQMERKRKNGESNIVKPAAGFVALLFLFFRLFCLSQPFFVSSWFLFSLSLCLPGFLFSLSLYLPVYSSYFPILLQYYPFRNFPVSFSCF